MEEVKLVDPDRIQPGSKLDKLRQKMRRHTAVIEKLSFDEAMGAWEMRIDDQLYYVREPSIKQQRLLGAHLDAVRTDPDKSDEDALCPLLPFFCKYDPEAADLVPVEYEEAEDLRGSDVQRIIRRLFKPVVLADEIKAAGIDSPNA